MRFINFIYSFISDKPYYTFKNTEKKAKIKSHSDKTKDMPKNAIMAFCTFYKSYYDGKFNDDRLKHLKESNYDYCYKNISALTVLRFKKKPMVEGNYINKFDIVLYPNSLFLMPLSTNRLYTHEIVPSVLPINMIPTRMGYVIRCSNTTAIYKNNCTFIKDDTGMHILEPITSNDADALREKYYKENTTIEKINYDNIYFSMNSGDYKKPIL